MRRSIMMFFIISFFVMVAACSNGTDENLVKEQPTKNQEAVDQEKEVPDLPANVYPLTGIGTNEEVTNQPIGVIINNHPSARPQSGLPQADIVYEVLAEGDVTRFLAIYQSEEPEIIGPVRSARDYYIDLSKGFNSFFVAHGWSPEAKKLLQAQVVPNMNGIEYDGILFWRDKSRVAPHNSYISYENIKKGADNLGITLESSVQSYSFLTEDEIQDIQGTEVKSVRVAYSSRELFAAVYKYNEQTEKYDRYSNNEQTVDRETKNSVSLDNVFIVEATHSVIDNVGRKRIDVTSGGKGLLLQKGKIFEVEWENQDGRIIPMLDGETVSFVPGKTWINVIPTNPGIDGAVSY